MFDIFIPSSSSICYSASHQGIDLEKPFFVGAREGRRNYQPLFSNISFAKSTLLDQPLSASGKEFVVQQYQRGCFPYTEIKHTSEGCKFDNSRSDSPCNNVTCVADATSADCREYRYTYCRDKNPTMLKDPGCFTMQPYSDFDSWCPFKRKINDNVKLLSPCHHADCLGEAGITSKACQTYTMQYCTTPSQKTDEKFCPGHIF